MSRIAFPEQRQAYSLPRVCRVGRVARAAVYRHRLPPPTQPSRRPGPVGALA